MSSTRRVTPGSRREQHGWASAPEFDELRGLNGSAVAFKAALIDDPQKRSLLFFLQALSLRDGGIKRVARELVELFPEQIGTETMLEIGCKPGKRLTQEQRNKIYIELYGDDSIFGWILNADYAGQNCQTSAQEFCEVCREKAQSHLDEFLERLCCDPKVAVTDDPAEGDKYRDLTKIVLEDADREEEGKGEFDIASVYYFPSVLASLFEYQRRYEQRVRAAFVETSIGSIVFEALDYALETGRSALILGNSGIGKTTALKAWTELHLGQARYVQLKGITHRTGFFREVARALGVARGGGLSASKVQARIEYFLQRTNTMLIIDEGQYLLAPGARVATPPELINWLLTACYNEGVPFVISATSEFTRRRAVVERHSTWSSEQLRRRIRRVFTLPEVPTKDDLIRVATKLLPDMNRDAVSYVVGYSLVSKGFFQAITDSIEDARLIARRAGREEIRFADLKSAITDWRSPSDSAL